MKSFSKYIYLLILIAFLPNINFAQCKAKQVVKECRNSLKPYYYDGYAVSDIIFTEKDQKFEVEFTAFAKQKYRLVFCTSGFAEKVSINVYDKNSRSKTRKNIFSTESIDKTVWNLVPPKTTTYYIQYDVPPDTDGKGKTACVVMLIGYTDVAYGADFDE